VSTNVAESITEAKTPVIVGADKVALSHTSGSSMMIPLTMLVFVTGLAVTPAVTNRK
jgi:hypothetical protein